MDYGEFPGNFQEPNALQGNNYPPKLYKRRNFIYNHTNDARKIGILTRSIQQHCGYRYMRSIQNKWPIRKRIQHLSACFLLSLSGILIASSAHSAIYRYIDPQGRLVFTDKPKHAGYIQLEKTLQGWTVRPSYSWKRNQRKFSPAIERIAEKHSLSHHLVHAVITVESAYNPQAKSKAGAQGLMQLMPATAHRFGVDDPYNPTQNINAGTEYLKHLLTLFKNNLSLALAAYNAGENTVKRYNNRIPPYKETQNYVRKVLKHYRKYSASEKNT